MNLKPNILVLMAALALMLTPRIQGQTTSPPYLSQFPSVERVKGEIRGADATDTAARQSAAFWWLNQIAMAVGGSGKLVSSSESGHLYSRYIDAFRSYAQIYASGRNLRWEQLLETYKYDPVFGDELIKRFFTADFRAGYYKFSGKQPPQMTTSQPKTPPTAQPNASERASAESYNAQGNEYFHAKNFAKAIEAYDRAIAIDPSYEKAYVGLAISYTETKQWQLAVATFQKSLTLGNTDPFLLLLLGGAHRELKQYDEALKVFRSVIELQPAAEALVSAHDEIGSTYWEMGQFQDAVSAYKTALRIDPNDVDAHRELGLSYYRLSQYPNALAEVQQAIRLNPKNASSFRALGYIFVKMGKKQEAMEAYKTLLTLNIEMAQQLYAEINKIEPSNKRGTATSLSETNTAETYLAEGIKYNDANDHASAIEAYKKAIALNPKMSEAHYRLSSSYFLLDRDQEALVAINEALRLSPKEPAYYGMLGSIHFDLRQYELALPALQQAVQLKPDLALAHFYVGRTYLRLGRKEEAIKVYPKLAALDEKRAQQLYAEIINPQPSPSSGTATSQPETNTSQNQLEKLRASAERGSAIAQNNLGRRYEQGKGVAADKTEARKWFLMAANQGDASGKVNLCESYANELHVYDDSDANASAPIRALVGSRAVMGEAMKWCGVAANLGDTGVSKWTLGVLYAKGGPGVKPNYEEAYFWLSMSKDEDVFRDKVKKKLTPEKRAEIEQRAKDWKP